MYYVQSNQLHKRSPQSQLSSQRTLTHICLIVISQNYFFILAPFQVGRNIDEILRLVQAFQYADQYGEVCPEGWRPGKEAVSHMSCT